MWSAITAFVRCINVMDYEQLKGLPDYSSAHKIEGTKYWLMHLAKPC